MLETFNGKYTFRNIHPNTRRIILYYAQYENMGAQMGCKSRIKIWLRKKEDEYNKTNYHAAKVCYLYFGYQVVRIVAMHYTLHMQTRTLTFSLFIFNCD